MKRWSCAIVLAAALAAVGAVPSEAGAQWYARGEFNGWGLDHLLVDSGDGTYFTGTVSGLPSGTDFFFKVATSDWSMESPPGFGQDIRVRSDSMGNINIHFWDIQSWDDGWRPAGQRRVGYDDHGLFGWEISGSFNDWSGGESWHLTDLGNGLYGGQFKFSAGIHEFKFRQQGTFDTNIGNNGFSNNAGNNSFAVANDSDDWLFQLDLPNGRWRVVPSVPDPLDQWYVRGDFNAWSADNLMTSHGDDHYSTVVTGLDPGEWYDFKVTTLQWTVDYPVSNGRVIANDSGEAAFHFRNKDTWTDGWQPSDRARVGYGDPGHDWEIAGTMNEWGGGAEWQLALLGNGVYRGHFPIEAGEDPHAFKFRKSGSWDVSIGSDFGNSASDIVLNVEEDGRWAFVLDLPNGRWRTFFVPPGDATIDGMVNISDLSILASNWQQTGRTWEQGDFTGEGVVNIADLSILAGNWQAGVSGSAAMSFSEALAMFDAFNGVVIPEPAALGLLGLAGLALVRRRK